MIKDGALWDSWHDQDFQLAGGYGALVEKMAADVEGRVQLNSRVTDVFWRKGLAGVGYRYNGLETALVSRQMIITLPIGVLQSGAVKIEPALPNDMQAAIDSLEMGQVVVVPMMFSEPFWQNGSTAPEEWRDPSDRRSFLFPHGGGKGGNGVVGWFAGDAARELSELEPEAALARVIYWLEEASGRKDIAGLLRWYRIQDWQKDPYSLGSYSLTRPGGSGGEATAPAPHYQTVHGAYLSGKRVAQQVGVALGAGEIEEEEPYFELL